MRTRKSLALFLAALFVLCIIAGCKPTESITAMQSAKPTEKIDTSFVNQTDTSFETAIAAIMDDRLTAIQTQDYDLYMSVITKNNQFFFNEQERWFMSMIDEHIHDVYLQIVSTRMIDEHTAVVEIAQEHKLIDGYDDTKERETSQSFYIVYPLLFKFEDGKWMDYGYNFLEYKTDRFIVKYMEGEQRVVDFTQMLNDAFDNLDKIYELKPLPDYELKLFYDREMLRQQSVPDTPWLFTGWSEPDESLKIYTGHEEGYKGYPGVVMHELVHHLSIRICNNNLPVWMLEGIAMYDGSAFYGLDKSKTLANLNIDNVSFSIEHLEKIDLGSDLTEQQISEFYGTSYMYVRYICETYGRDTLLKMFYEAGKKPFHDSTLNYTFEQVNQQTANEVLQSVLGLTKEQLSSNYFEWLDTLDFDNLD